MTSTARSYFVPYGRIAMASGFLSFFIRHPWHAIAGIGEVFEFVTFGWDEIDGRYELHYTANARRFRWLKRLAVAVLTDAQRRQDRAFGGRVWTPPNYDDIPF